MFCIVRARIVPALLYTLNNYVLNERMISLSFTPCKIRACTGMVSKLFPL